MAQVVTNSEGQWTLAAGPPTAPAPALWIRALFAGAGPYGAAVSEAISVRLAPPAPVAPAAPAVPPAG